MSSSVQSADSDARVSCVLDVYPEDTLDYLEEAVSAGRHFSYAIPYVAGKTIKKQLCLIQVIGYEYIDRGIWGSLYVCIANSGRRVTTAQRYLDADQLRSGLGRFLPAVDGKYPGEVC